MGVYGAYHTTKNAQLKQIIEEHHDFMDVNPIIYQTLDIDKAYYLIQYLLCGCIDGGEAPMGYVVPIREENELLHDYDCDMYFLTAQQVQEAAAYLNTLDNHTLRNKYDFKSMREKKIYPLWGEESDNQSDEIYEYIEFYLEKIRDFFNQAAEKEEAVILCLC